VRDHSEENSEMTLSSDGRANAESMVDRIHRMEKRWVSDDGETPNEQALWDMIEDCNRVFRYLLRNEKPEMTKEELAEATKIINLMNTVIAAHGSVQNAIESLNNIVTSQHERLEALENIMLKVGKIVDGNLEIAESDKTDDQGS